MAGLRSSERQRADAAPNSLRGANIGCAAKTLKSWIRQAGRDAGTGEGLTTDERARLKAIEKENRELKEANEILRLAAASFRTSGAQPPEMMVKFID